MSVRDGAWLAIAGNAEENREMPRFLDSGLAPVTPEAAGSSPVDPANFSSGKCDIEPVPRAAVAGTMPSGMPAASSS